MIFRLIDGRECHNAKIQIDGRERCKSKQMKENVVKVSICGGNHIVILLCNVTT